MKIPKSVKIGKNKIKVVQTHALVVGKTLCRGCFDRSDNSIVVTYQSPAGQDNTFWHELTHAILHDMDNKLSYDEKFVSAFADRLTQAIRSAKFD